MILQKIKAILPLYSMGSDSTPSLLIKYGDLSKNLFSNKGKQSSLKQTNSSY